MLNVSKILGVASVMALFVSMEAMALPGGYMEIPTGQTDFRIYSNKAGGSVIIVKAPAKSDTLDEASVNDLKNQVHCDSYDVSSDRKSLLGSGCVNPTTKERASIDVRLANGKVNVVIYNEKANVSDVHAIIAESGK